MARSSSLVAHDLFRKPAPTFPDHALDKSAIAGREHTNKLRGVAPIPELERDGFMLNRHRALALWWSLIFSENRHPLFRIML
jgi:hypothetical protein